jgi:hypothetical protein
MERVLVANQLKLPSGKIIRSYSKHHFVSAVEDGITYFVDGGVHSPRGSAAGEDCSVYSDDNFDLVRMSAVWGSYGKNGDEELQYIPICDLEDDHIKNILKSQVVSSTYKTLLTLEMIYRATYREYNKGE